MASVGALTAQLRQKIAALEGSGIEGSKEAAADAKAWAEKLAEVKPDDFIPAAIELEKVKSLAGKKVEGHHVGPGHTDNDLFFFFPDDNVLVAGDLVFTGLHPYFDKDGGATSSGWMKSLARMVTLCNEKTVVIPGHGEIGDIESVKKQIKYFEDVREAVGKAIEEGKKREEVEKMTLPQYAGYKLEIARGLVMGGVFDELSK
jgi:glyoxylase-like metal-dependent hydrolase (beta-lactamase superfamily II)